MSDNSEIRTNAPATEAEKETFDPVKSAETLSQGKFKLRKPIRDGEKVYDELQYDFQALSAWELAKAIDAGTTGQSNVFRITDTQALSLFAAAAAKATAGLDATDIRERMGAADGLAAMRVASIFFNAFSLEGSLRFTK